MQYHKHTKKPTINETSLGPKALGFIREYYSKRSTDKTIAYYFDVLYGFGISSNAIECTKGTPESV